MSFKNLVFNPRWEKKYYIEGELDQEPNDLENVLSEKIDNFQGTHNMQENTQAEKAVLDLNEVLFLLFLDYESK